jgi:thiol-disulfide isomerase/thioredoxin
MQTWTIIGESASANGGTGSNPMLALEDLAKVTGWQQKPEGWCRGTECIPASFIGEAAHASHLSAAKVGEALGAAVATDQKHRIAVIGTRVDASSALSSGQAPEVSLLGVDGVQHGLFDGAEGKTMVVAFSSWCGCRYDLPGWNALKNELSGSSFNVVAVAIDESLADVLPWAENIDYPVLVDTDRRFADTYGLTNVPTVFWLDEQRRIVRQPSAEFSDDQFTEIHGVASGPHLDAVRKWVLNEELPAVEDQPTAQIGELTAAQRQARTEFRLALELHRLGFLEAARARVALADQLAPDDFTIWRAGMKLIGEDPFGAEFFDRYTEWQQRHGGPLQVLESET